MVKSSTAQSGQSFLMAHVRCVNVEQTRRVNEMKINLEYAWQEFLAWLFIVSAVGIGVVLTVCWSFNNVYGG